MALLPLTPKPFTQPSPDATAAGHPLRNLKHYAHPPLRHRQAETRAPKTGRQKLVPADGEYKPRVGQRANLQPTVKSVAGVNMGQSDVNSEAIGSQMGPASPSATPAPFKTRKASAKQMPFYGKVR